MRTWSFCTGCVGLALGSLWVRAQPSVTMLWNVSQGTPHQRLWTENERSERGKGEEGKKGMKAPRVTNRANVGLENMRKISKEGGRDDLNFLQI